MVGLLSCQCLLCYVSADYNTETTTSFCLHFSHTLMLLHLLFVVRKFQELATVVIFGENSFVMLITVNTGM